MERTVKLTRLLSSADEDEVYIELEGRLYEIEIGHVEETFDGFYTLYPASLTLKPKEENEE